MIQHNIAHFLITLYLLSHFTSSTINPDHVFPYCWSKLGVSPRNWLLEQIAIVGACRSMSLHQGSLASLFITNASSKKTFLDHKRLTLFLSYRILNSFVFQKKTRDKFSGKQTPLSRFLYGIWKTINEVFMNENLWISFLDSRRQRVLSLNGYPWHIIQWKWWCSVDIIKNYDNYYELTII